MRRAALSLAALLIQAPALAMCEVSSAAPRFGLLHPAHGAHHDAEGYVAVHCAEATSVRVQLGGGLHGVSASERRMAADENPQHTLIYGLYLDAARRRIWGEGSAGAAEAILPSGVVQPIYGRIAAGQDPPPGRYGDLIEITVEW